MMLTTDYTSSSNVMLAEDNTIRMYSGDSAKFELRIEDDDGSLPSLTGAEVIWTLKKTTNSTEQLIRKSVGFGVELTEPTATSGGAHITLDGVDTELLKCGTYTYDVRIQLASGSRHTVITPTAFILMPTNGTF